MKEKELISVIDAAKHLGQRKQTVFKVIKKFKITPIKHRHSQHRGQAISYITEDDLIKLTEYFSNKKTSRESTLDSENYDLTDVGVFYLIQLEPTHDPGRFKVGFASTMNERLRQHRCSAPFAKVIAVDCQNAARFATASPPLRGPLNSNVRCKNI